MAEAGKFWDRTAERYSRSPISDEASYQRKLAMTREVLRADMDVLEIGCGTGSTALLHAPHVKHILATDLSANMIEIARGKADAEGVRNVTFRRSSVDELKVDDGSFEVVLGMSILHLLEDRDKAIASVYRMLKPGGVFVSSTVCLSDSRLKLLRPILPVGRVLGLLPLVRFFTSDDLVQGLTSAGFDIEKRWQSAPQKATFLIARKPA